MEIKHGLQIMFKKKIRGWFAKNSVKTYYNEFIHSLSNDDVSMALPFKGKSV